MPSAGGQVPTEIDAPAVARAFAMANPNPPSSATPATKARLPERSMGSIGEWGRGEGKVRRLSGGAVGAGYQQHPRREDLTRKSTDGSRAARGPSADFLARSSPCRCWDPRLPTWVWDPRLLGSQDLQGPPSGHIRAVQHANGHSTEGHCGEQPQQLPRSRERGFKHKATQQPGGEQ